MQSKDEFVFNGNKYMVVIPINYNNEIIYFVINQKNENDTFFCRLVENTISPIMDKKIIESLLIELGKRIDEPFD